MRTISVGDSVHAEVAEYLPPTTRVVQDEEGADRVTYIRRFDGTWAYPASPRTRYRTRDLGVVRVQFLPTPSVKVPDSVETFDEWEHKFVAAVEAGANRAGVGRSTLDTAYRQIGVERREAAAALSPGYRGSTGEELRHAPIGTLVRSTQGGTKGWVWHKRSARYWYRIAPSQGDAQRAPEGRWVLVRWGVDGPTEPPEVVLTDEERLRLRTTKSKAWRVAMQLKRQHGWCGTLEAIVHQGGVSKADQFMGPRFDIRQQATLPVGSLVLWVSVTAPDRWDLLIRDDTMRNIARTRRLIGSTTGTRNSRETVDVLWRPDSGEPMEVLLPEEPMQTSLGRLLPGWQFMYSGNIYRVREQGRVIDHVGYYENGNGVDPHVDQSNRTPMATYSPDQFGGGVVSLAVTFMPEVQS